MDAGNYLTDCDWQDTPRYPDTPQSENVSQGSHPLPTTSESATSSVPTASSITNSTQNWSRQTWIHQKYGSHRREEISRLVDYFNRPTLTRDEVDSFLISIPRDSGWIRPVLYQANRVASKKCVVFLLLCPRKNLSAGTDGAVSQEESFTVAWMSAIRSGESPRSRSARPY